LKNVNVIFLDIDGVLNSRRFLDQLDPEERTDDSLDPQAVARLNRIAERTQAKIVISSTWRIIDPLERILDILQSHGFKGEIVGKTPVLSGPRGHEIQAWVTEHREVKSFVILDDRSDMDGVSKRLIQTTMADGLLDRHVEPACTVLAKRLFWRW
jgi:hypothetical protein